MLVLAAGLAAVVPARPSTPTAASTAATPGAAQSGLAATPLDFIENRGQIDRRAGYYVEGGETSVYFTRRGLALSLSDPHRAGRRWNLRLSFLDASAHTRPVGQDPSGAVVSYFKGRPQKWRKGVPSYSTVAYEDVWPGIDVVYSGTGKALKYEFVVAPGADPGAIDLGWRGASGLDVNARGQLEVATPVGKFRDQTPHTYQLVNGRRVPVSSSYALGDRHSYGFRLGAYDQSKPLVIDPAVFVYSGFLGGSDDDGANNVTVDSSGNLYVSGTTSSVDFPATVGPDTSYGGGIDDAFVAKVRADGTGLVYAG